MYKKILISTGLLLFITGAYLMLVFYMNMQNKRSLDTINTVEHSSYADAGKACSDSSQCLGRCLANNSDLESCMDRGAIICNHDFMGHCEENNSSDCFRLIVEILNKKMVGHGIQLCEPPQSN